VKYFASTLRRRKKNDTVTLRLKRIAIHLGGVIKSMKIIFMLVDPLTIALMSAICQLVQSTVCTYEQALMKEMYSTLAYK